MASKNLWAILVVGVVILAGGYYVMKPVAEDEARSGPPMVTVKVPELSAAAVTGKTAFDANCAACHGVNAAGQDGVAPPLIHKIYAPGHHGDISFWRAAKMGARAHHWSFGDMPPVEKVTDDELARIVLYVRELQRANGIN